MMHKLNIILIIFFCLVFGNIHAQSDYIFIPHSIDKQFSEDAYADSFYFVSQHGKIVIPIGKYTFSYSDTIHTIGFVLKGKEGIYAINNKGKELFKVYNFDNGPDILKDGMFRIMGKNNKVGFADSLGNVLIKPAFDFVEPFHNGYAIACNGGHLLSIDTLDNHHKWVGGKWGVISKEGKIIIPFIFKSISYQGDTITLHVF